MKKLIILLVVILFQQVLIAQKMDSLLVPVLKLDLTLFDIPYQFDAAKTVNNGKSNFGSFFKGYANPSMSQSLSVTSSFYNASHYGIDRLFKVQDRYWDTKFVNILLHLATISLFDYYSTYLPGAGGWLHEEYHRAILTRGHVNSFNDMNTFPFGQELVSVNSLTDEDLIRFKKEKPYDFIRMHVAGIEGEYLLMDKLQRNNFFNNQNITHEISYLLSAINSVFYVTSSAEPDDVDIDTDKINLEEKNISDRDFTGYDFTAWAYDLFDPNQAYEDRGVHPLGNGINRYRKTTHLSPEALDYLEKQGKLQWLNFVSPMMFGFKKIKLNDNYSFNFAVKNILTSFGNDISFNLLLKAKGNNMIFRYHHANNFEKGFPAIEAELFEHRYDFKKNTFLLSPRLIAGIQPKDQSFFTKDSEFLGFAGCRVDWVLGKIHPWIEVGAKTDGWIAGNEFLDKNFSFRMGMSVRFERKSR